MRWQLLKRFCRIISGLVVVFSCSHPANQPHGDEKLLLESFQRSFDTELESSDPDSALRLAIAVLDLKNEKIPPLTFSQAAMQAGIIFYDREKLDSALVYYDSALRFARENDQKMMEAKLYNLMANVFSDQQNYTEAVVSVKKSMHINLENKYAGGLAANYSTLGLVSDSQYQYDSAIFFYTKAAHLFDSLKLFNNKGIVLGNIAGIYNHLGELEKSEQLQKEAVKLFTASGNKMQLIISYNRLGNVLRNMERYDSAIHYYRKSAEMAGSYGDGMSLLIAKFNIGKTFGLMNDYEKMESIINEVETYCRDNQITDGIMRCMLLLGQTNVSLNKYSEADSIFTNGLKLATENDYPYFRQAFLEELTALGLQQSGQERLKSLYDELSAVNTELGVSDLKKRIAELEVKYESERKDNQIRSLSMEKKMAKMRTRLLVYLSLLLLVSGIFSVFYYYNRLKILRQAHRLTEKENEKNLLLRQKAELETKLKEEEVKSQLLLIRQKDQELVYNALSRARSIEFFHRLKEQIITFHTRFKTRKDQEDFSKVIQQMEAANNLEALGQFEKIFRELHPGFFENLSTNYPDLTGRELQLCAMLRLNMNSKDIASVTFLAPTSIDTARYRIRKKMNLDSDASLIGELLKF